MVACLGLVLAVAVTAASVQDRDAAVPLLQRLRDLYFSIRPVWADGGYAGSLVDWARANFRLTLEIVKRTDDTAGFVVLPRRWVVLRCWWVGWAVVVSGRSSGPGMACGWLPVMARSTWPPGATRRLDR
ncbi:transposase [Streptomyces sp. NPDC005209]|uniref:transposase n=1 Tax=Streptomyces sp. NPDC005209 TaxID=3156715 RepID=UPI0033A952E0